MFFKNNSINPICAVQMSDLHSFQYKNHCLVLVLKEDAHYFKVHSRLASIMTHWKFDYGGWDTEVAVEEPYLKFNQFSFSIGAPRTVDLRNANNLRKYTVEAIRHKSLSRMSEFHHEYLCSMVDEEIDAALEAQTEAELDVEHLLSNDHDYQPYRMIIDFKREIEQLKLNTIHKSVMASSLDSLQRHVPGSGEMKVHFRVWNYTSKAMKKRAGPKDCVIQMARSNAQK